MSDFDQYGDYMTTSVSQPLLNFGRLAEAVAEVAASGPLAATTIPVGGPTGFPAVAPNSRHVYVPLAVINTVAVIDTTINTVIRNPLTFGRNPMAVAVTQDGNRVYVANFDSDTLSVINTTTNVVVTTIPVGRQPAFVAVVPDGSRVYVSNFSDPGTVSVIDTSTNTVIATIPVGADPFGVAVAPNGRYVYVSSQDLNTGNTRIVSVIDTTTDTVVTTTQVDNGADFVVATARNVYAAGVFGRARTVSVIDV